MVDIFLMIFFLLISAALMVISRIVRKSIKKNCRIEVEAVVEKKEGHYSYHSNRRRHRDIYGYNYKGVHYTGTAKSVFGKEPVGNRLTLFIDPDKPQDCYRKKDLVFPKMLFILGILMCCISVVNLFQILMGILK